MRRHVRWLTLLWPLAASGVGAAAGPDYIGSYLGTRLCLNVLGGLKVGNAVGLWSSAEDLPSSNSLFRSDHGRILSGDLCLASPDGHAVIAAACTDKAVVTFTTGSSHHLVSSSGGCLDVGEHGQVGAHAVLAHCEDGAPQQQWKLPASVHLGDAPWPEPEPK